MSDDSFTLRIGPREWFKDHLERNPRTPRSGEEFVVRIPWFLNTWSQYAADDITQGNVTQLDAASRAVQWSIVRVQDEFGIDFEDVETAHVSSAAAAMEEGTGSGITHSSMPTSHELKLDEVVKIRLAYPVYKQTQTLGDFVGVDRSVAARHLMCIAFRWYSEPVFEDERFSKANTHTQEYADQLVASIDERLSTAQEEYDL